MKDGQRAITDQNWQQDGIPILKRVIISSPVEPLKPFDATLTVRKVPPDGWDPDDPESVDADLWRETETVITGIRNGLPGLDSPDIGDIGWVLDDYFGQPVLLILEPAGVVMNLVKYVADSGIIKWQRYIRYGATTAVMGVVYHPGEDMLYATLAQYANGFSDTTMGETYLARVNPASGHIESIVEGVYPVVGPAETGTPAAGTPIVGNRRALCAASLSLSGEGNVLCIGGAEPLDDNLSQDIYVFWVADGEVIRSESTGLANIPWATGWSVSGVYGSDDAVFSRSGVTGSPGVDGVTQRVGETEWTCSETNAMACNFSPTGPIGAGNFNPSPAFGFEIDEASGVATTCVTIPSNQIPIWFDGAFRSPEKSGSFGAEITGVAASEDGARWANAESGAGYIVPAGTQTEMIVRASTGVDRETTTEWVERCPDGNPALVGDPGPSLGVCFQGDNYVIAGGYRRVKIENSHAFNPR